MRRRRSVGNLPVELSSFVDRAGERAELRRLLTGSRLVTVTGVGGVGKTRVALRLAAEMERTFSDGAWMADLSALSDAELLVETVGQVFGVRNQTVRPQLEVVAGYLASRRVLLVLDNCEHQAGPCAALVDALLRAAPGLQVLATSRQPLGVSGEQVFPLPPLPVTQTDGPVLDAGSVLFGERAAAAAPGFAVTDGNRAAVARVCRLLDGIPLSIELAAAWARVLSVEQIADLIEGRPGDRVRLLSRGGPGESGRHGSLRTVLDSSHGLCTAAEALLWARVSVFAGDFDLDAVREVCCDDQLDVGDVLTVLAGLVDKSILITERTPSGVRYRLLDTIRDYGLDLLRGMGQEQTLRCRHRDRYLRLAHRFDAGWCGPDQAGWYDRLRREHPNVRAALDFSLSDPREHAAGLELAAALRYFWFACGYVREGRHHLDRALALDPPPGPALTRALWVCAWLIMVQGDLDTATALLDRCRRFAEAQHDVAALGWVGYVSAVTAVSSGDLSRALALAEEAQRAHLAGGDPGTGLLLALSAQALPLALMGEFDRAAALTRDCRDRCDEQGNLWMRSYADWLDTVIALGRGDARAAVGHAREALRAKRRLGDSVGAAMTLDLLATATATGGDLERAARLLGIAHRMWQAMGLLRKASPDLSATCGRAEELARAQLGGRRFDAVLADGLDLDLDAGLAYAAEEKISRRAPGHPRLPAAWAPLTRREIEVAQLIAGGLTNQQIADQLVISRRTANTHVEHIRTKLDFTSRSQVAAWVATRHQPQTGAAPD
ncbi:LuxR C-terminal-related transcriptional regulator [Dactylosporangium sp. NBC_01737]|uniref:ATP-binding protein n=1 Tax=Dactylosporangium sp. NBC_01737 TaxID=2975959 RepID=UPI002E13C83F|nr:LuxR C-terminal-related transcriptional regulator [Dactylosporangium sp. NBC_01737]